MFGRQSTATTDANPNKSEAQQVKLELLPVYLESLGHLLPYDDPLVQSHSQDVQRRIQSALNDALLRVSSTAQDSDATEGMSRDQANVILQTLREECFLEVPDTAEFTRDTSLLRPNYYDCLTIRNQLIQLDSEGRTLLGHYKNPVVAHWDNLCKYYRGIPCGAFTSATGSSSTARTANPSTLPKNVHLTDALHIFLINVKFTIPSLQIHYNQLLKRRQGLDRMRLDLKRRQTEASSQYKKECAHLAADFDALLSGDCGEDSIAERLHEYGRRELVRQLTHEIPKVLQSPIIQRVVEYYDQSIHFLQETCNFTIPSSLRALKCCIVPDAAFISQNLGDDVLYITRMRDELLADVLELLSFLIQRSAEVGKAAKKSSHSGTTAPVDAGICAAFAVAVMQEIHLEELDDAVNALQEVCKMLSVGRVPWLMKLCESETFRCRLVSKLTMLVERIKRLNSGLADADGELEKVQMQTIENAQRLQLYNRREKQLHESLKDDVTKMLKADRIFFISE